MQKTINDGDYDLDYDPIRHDDHMMKPGKKTKSCSCDKKCIVIWTLSVIIMVLSADLAVLIYYNYVVDSDSPYSLYPTKADALAGVYLMNKAYNLLSGQELYSQPGIDIISYQWDGILTNTVSGIVYEIPIEFRSVPNIIPSCAISTQVNDVYYSTSTSVLSEQSASSSHGFSQSVTASVGFYVGLLTIYFFAFILAP